MSSPEVVNRRELKTRGRAWPRVIAGVLARAGVTPNAVSLLSILFAALASLFFLKAGLSLPPSRPWWPWLVAAAACIQLRLLCNLLDGLLAIEGGLKTKTGELYNEIPDRFADVFILVGAGYGLAGYPLGPMLGWVAAVVAVLTAYVRLLGGSLGFVQDFSGPLAKQHRMFALTVGALAAAVELAMRETVWSLYAALWIIIVGALFTFARRTRRIADQLGAR
jgi:phosphatidylglycerophosphate synthase